MAFLKRRESRPTIALNESVVQNLLGKDDSHLKRYAVMVPRCMTQNDSEADVLAIRKSGFCDEFEIKLSRADFFKDREKVVRYRESDITSGEDYRWFVSRPQERTLLAPWEKYKLHALSDGDMVVNHFWYVVKKGIVVLDDLPDYAGLITVDDTGLLEVLRQPKKLHNRKLSHEQMFKFACFLNKRFWNYRSKALKSRDCEDAA